MNKVFYLWSMLLALFVFTGCGDDEDMGNDKPQDLPINISLSKTEVKINVEEDVNIDVSGVDIDNCTVSSDNEFIAEAMVYGGKINIEGEHIGETAITVKFGDAEAKCKVSVTSTIDYIGSTVTDWDISYDELKEKIERPYDSFMNDTQRGSKNFTYTKSGYKITNRYYFENGLLCGVEKVINSSGSDADAFLNINNSLRGYTDYETSYSETINSYPKARMQGYIYSYPQKYYAVYEQTKYDILWETGTRPATKNIIYFAKDLETAKEHKFTWLN